MSESETNVRASLSARVALHVESQPTSRRSGRARAAVVAQRDEIARAVADGWTVKAIWRTLVADGSVAVGYQAFRRQVAELVTNVETRRGAAPVASAVAANAAKEPIPRSVASNQSRFAHSAAPQKDEIY